MAKLLISVRTPDEADLAVKHGADLIDIKEPANGPMGMANQNVMRSIIKRVAMRRPVSAAFGELNDPPVLTSLPRQLSMIKIGLAHCGDHWLDSLRAWNDALTRKIDCQAAVIPVAYADLLRTGDCPTLDDVIANCSLHDWPGVMIDTFDKTAGSLFDHLSDDTVAAAVRLAHSQGIYIGLAGSLSAALAVRAAAHGPDFVGVRGGVCVHSRRDGQLDPQLVQSLSISLARAAGPPAKADRRRADSPVQ